MARKKKHASESVEQLVDMTGGKQGVVSGLCVNAYNTPAEIRDKLTEGLKVFEYHTWDYLYKLHTTRCQYRDTKSQNWLRAKFRYMITKMLGLRIIHEYNSSELNVISIVVVETANKYYIVKLVYDDSEKYCVKIEFNNSTAEELLESGIYPWRPSRRK